MKQKMVSCESKVIKLLLGVFNLLWLILGSAVVFIGVRLVKWNNDFSAATDLAHINLKTASFAILAIGVIIVLISFLGFFGACCENAFMLNAYGLLMILLVGAQIFALVYAIQNNNDIEKEISNGIKKTIQEINKDYETAYLLELIQYNLKCCGWIDYNDYKNSTVPGSCCGIEPKNRDSPNPTCETSNKQLYKVGCEHQLHFDQIDTIFKGTIGISIVIVMFEFILIFAACCLARDVRY